jgi:hypothetical protein
VRVSLLDLYVLRGTGASLECLTLRRALDDAVALLGSGAAGPVEDVLRIC